MIDPNAAVRQALAGIAPEADLDAVAPDADLQEELDLDSMDFLNFLIALGELTGIHVPESDYEQVHTLRGCREYIAARVSSPRDFRPRPV
jgi:acyl carrier protein